MISDELRMFYAMNPATTDSIAQTVALAGAYGKTIALICNNHRDIRHQFEAVRREAEQFGGTKRICAAAGSASIDFKSGGRAVFINESGRGQGHRGLRPDLILRSDR